MEQIHFKKMGEINFKVTLLFMVTGMIFSLFIIPIVRPFNIADECQSGFAYFGWYLMCFILALVWGGCVQKNGCWFFSR